jgi:hypothetical protein
MADGTYQGWAWGGAQAAPPRLKDAVGRVLVARCRCGASAQIDAGPWIAERLGEARLSTLESRLRCRCGARGVALEIAASGVAEPAEIFVWR